MLAIKNKHILMVKLLLESGSNTAIKNKCKIYIDDKDAKDYAEFVADSKILKLVTGEVAVSIGKKLRPYINEEKIKSSNTYV